MTERFTIETLKSRIAALPVSAAGRRQFSLAIKNAAIELFEAKKAEGWSQVRFANALGINQATLSYWRRRIEETASAESEPLRPVSLVEDMPAPTRPARTLVLSDGVRVEGLSMNELVALIREFKC